MAIVVLLLIGRDRFQQNKELAKDRRASMEELREERESEREMRREEESLRRACETRCDRLLGAARWWRDVAHDMRHGRLNDRTAHQGYEERGGITPLILPDVPLLPRLAEDEG